MNPISRPSRSTDPGEQSSSEPKPRHPARRRSSETDGATDSAPALGTRPAPPLRLDSLVAGSYDPSSTTEDLEQLLAELSIAPADRQPAPSSGVDSPPRSERIQLAQMLSDTLNQELANAAAARTEPQRLNAIQSALDLAPATAPAQWHDCLRQAAQLIGATSGNAASIDTARRVLASFVDLAMRERSDQLPDQAAELAGALGDAAASFPFAARCELLVAQSATANRLGSLTMVNAAILALIRQLPADSDAETTRRIATLAEAIPNMPIGHRALAAIKLYNCAPVAMPWRLDALERIAALNTLLPELAATEEFCKILNQEIYRLRIEQQ